ncbi:MAG TPA: methyltransferase domain-containing protein [Verrucomicrobiae bacterium]|nr:methyltransferase domain-containing protein [Verrucomicrobiae bacterium]
MSATADLYLPEIEAPEEEWEFSATPRADILGRARQNHFLRPDWPDANCEAVVRHYETELNAANGVILHLGAGRGELMETLRNHGFAVMGCEPAPHPTRLAREAHQFDEHTLHCSSAENFLNWLRRIGQSAQAIFFRHGWEHNLEFQALLPRMAEILRDGGRIIAVLPPPSTEHPREAHLSFLNELAIAGTLSNTHFEVERVDGDFADRFMAFVLKKTPARTVGRQETL